MVDGATLAAGHAAERAIWYNVRHRRTDEDDVRGDGLHTELKMHE